MAIAWSQIEAEANASGFRERLVEVYRKYEGQPTDEKDGQGRIVKVTVSSFARHMGIPERTFNRWSNFAAQATQPEDRERLDEAQARAAQARLRQASPERRREVARELLDDPEVASDPGVRARVRTEPTPERLEQAREVDRKLHEERQQRHGFRYIAVSDYVVKIKRLAREALNEAQGVEFDAEERELLGHDIDQTLAALNLLRAGVVGVADVNWDAELAKLGDLS